MEKKDWMRRIVDDIGLDSESVPGVSVIELAGDRRVLVERHEGVTEYSRERISFKVPFGLVRVCGCGLELMKMTKGQLIITGRIDSIQLHRRCR